MPRTKPTILIIHGAWHHPGYFSSVINLLEKQGYDVVCPHLPTCNNDEKPTKSLEDDVAVIRNTASKLIDDGHEIVALMHSYGGVVGDRRPIRPLYLREGQMELERWPEAARLHVCLHPAKRPELGGNLRWDDAALYCGQGTLNCQPPLRITLLLMYWSPSNY